MEESLLVLMKKKPDLDCFFVRNAGNNQFENSISKDRNLTLSKGFWGRKNKEVLKKFSPDFWIGGLHKPADFKLPFGIWLPAPTLSGEPVKWNGRRERLLAQSAIIFTDAGYYRSRLLEQFSFEKNKVILLSNAADPIFQPLSGLEKEQVKTQYAAGKEYFIITQHLDRTEDLITLLKSFSFFKKKLQSNMGLVISGAAKQAVRKISEKIQTFKYREDLQLVDELSTLESARLVAGAYGFLEPFNGLSARAILNAFQCRVPVIGASQGVIPEIGGQAILYRDTQDPETLGEQLILIYKNEKLRNELIEQGQLQLQQHNWEKNAEQLWLGIQQGTKRK
jgi:glycosyltransferase involved in cell wall biosynthesis